MNGHGPVYQCSCGLARVVPKFLSFPRKKKKNTQTFRIWSFWAGKPMKKSVPATEEVAVVPSFLGANVLWRIRPFGPRLITKLLGKVDGFDHLPEQFSRLWTRQSNINARQIWASSRKTNINERWVNSMPKRTHRHLPSADVFHWCLRSQTKIDPHIPKKN